MSMLRTIDTLGQEHILSCPGCWSWQLHYTEWVSLQWGAREFEEMVEAILRDHVSHDCTSPRLVMELWKNRGRP